MLYACVIKKEKLTHVQIQCNPRISDTDKTGILSTRDGSFGLLCSISLVETTGKTGNLRKPDDRVDLGTVRNSQVALYLFFLGIQAENF